MKFSFRIFLGFFIIVGISSYLLYSAFIKEIRPALRQSAEENLVETANLLAEWVSGELSNNGFNNETLQRVMMAFKQRQLDAMIWSRHKQHTDLNIYITNQQGRVVFHSEQPEQVGADYSQWNDVYLTLRGQYGARSTISDSGNPLSSIMYIAAPIYNDGQIQGVLTVFKPNLSFQPFYLAAQSKLFNKAAALLVISLLAGLLLSWWLSRSVQKLAHYALNVQQGLPVAPPQVHGSELKQLAAAMTEMKEKLEGKRYVENYVHTLAHQLKSPIASIRGAAELLQEDMPPEQQQRFIENINQESRRLEEIVAHMLALAELENKPEIKTKGSVNLSRSISELIDAKTIELNNKRLTVNNLIDGDIILAGDDFLLQQAFNNLLDNAIEFSPLEGSIEISAKASDRFWQIRIEDQGPGIPEYAVDRLFERFYSLPRPDSQLKSSGLGLCFVKEIMRLHDGRVSLENKLPHGAIASLYLPVEHYIK